MNSLIYKNKIVMKTSIYTALITVSLLAASCSTTKQASKNSDDDVYYSSKDAPKEKPQEYREPEKTLPKNSGNDANAASQDDYANPNSSSRKSNSETRTDENGNTYVNNNY